jgi:response regulator RpfG family c-di-GMP phosphodiesterase
MSANVSPGFDSPRILVVDDEALICELVQELLEGDGANVTTEVDGNVAMARLEEEPFDLVLTDLRLGNNTDGMQVLAHALQYHPDVVVILMTGFPTLENAVQALKSGAYDYITKPFTVDSLRAVIRRAVDHIRLRRENIQLREAMNLKRITEALCSTLELNEVLNVVLQSALNEFHADFGAVLLEGGERLTPRHVDLRDYRLVRLAASLGNGSEKIDLSPLYALHQHEAWREGSRNPVLVPTGAEPPFPCPLYSRSHRRSGMSVPLKAKGEFIGVLHISRDRSPQSFTEGNLQTLGMIAAQATFAIENAQLYDSLHKDYMAIIRSLANAVEAKDPYTRGHGDRVVKYTSAIGMELGFKEDILDQLRVAAILHDIGKIGIRDEVLLKPGKLTNEEYTEMKLHPIIGDRILGPIHSLDQVRVWVYQHHERVDGKGYPEGIGGSDLGLPSRALIVAEVFDALVTERAYKPAWPIPKVVNYLSENVDTHFDRDIVDVLVGILEREGDAFYRENIVVY